MPWYVPAALGGNRRSGPRPRFGAAAAGAVIAALALSIASCGGSAPNPPGAAGTYRVKVVKAKFPAKQRLGQTSLMRIGVRNTGQSQVPELTVTVSIEGNEGQDSSLPFGIRDPEPGIAQPDRPVWVLAEHYPKLAGSSKPGGAETANEKTFDFGPLGPGDTTEAVWKLTAVKTGRYTLRYAVGADLSGEAEAKTAGGVEPGGTFSARISEVPPNTVVTDSGAVVEIPPQRQRGNR